MIQYMSKIILISTYHKVIFLERVDNPPNYITRKFMPFNCKIVINSGNYNVLHVGMTFPFIISTSCS